MSKELPDEAKTEETKPIINKADVQVNPFILSEEVRQAILAEREQDPEWN